MLLVRKIIEGKPKYAIKTSSKTIYFTDIEELLIKAPAYTGIKRDELIMSIKDMADTRHDIALFGVNKMFIYSRFE
jgi:hypothetical protein